METIIIHLKYLIKLFFLKVEEPSVVLPWSYSTALLKLKVEKHLDKAEYKLHPIENRAVVIKIQIQRLQIEENKIKYLFHGFNKDFRLCKFEEDSYEEFLWAIEQKVKPNTSNYVFVDTEDYERLESTLFSDIDEISKEYCLDFIYKKHIDKLFDIKESVYSSYFSSYLKHYYTELLFQSFQYTDYDTLTQYLEELETLHLKDIHVRKVREKILQLIQEKSLLDVKLDNLSKCFQ